jgi:hypothetical protein
MSLGVIWHIAIILQTKTGIAEDLLADSPYALHSINRFVSSWNGMAQELMQVLMSCFGGICSCRQLWYMATVSWAVYLIIAGYLFKVSI